MLKNVFFAFLLASTALFAIPFEYQILKPGEGDTIRSGQLIKVHYKGWLSDSTYFDNSYERGEPLEFSLGTGQVIPGWDKGLVGMRVGEIRKLNIPYELGYGDRAIGPIPAKSDLYFEVELVFAEKPLPPDTLPKDISKMPWKELVPGVKVIDEKTGSGEATKPGTKIKLHYTGWTFSGRKFSSSKDLGRPLETLLGAGKFIPGVEVGLENLKPGAIRWLQISPAMGYGAKPFSMIPPNSTLLFRMEILDAEKDEALAETMDFFPDTSALEFKDGPEGLRYAVIKTGDGEPAIAGKMARVHYTGWLQNGTKFDSSRERGQEFAFPLGGGRVIRGWDLGVEGMLPGEKRILIIPPGLGYDSRGGGPIPGDATLIFAVEYLGGE